MEGAWRESSEGCAPSARTESCLQTVRISHWRTRRAGPVWRSASKGYARNNGIPSGGTATEGAHTTPGARMEVCLQRVWSAHAAPVTRMEGELRTVWSAPVARRLRDIIWYYLTTSANLL